jgi:hypothetical protein
LLLYQYEKQIAIVKQEINEVMERRRCQIYWGNYVIECYMWKFLSLCQKIDFYVFFLLIIPLIIIHQPIKPDCLVAFSSLAELTKYRIEIVMDCMAHERTDYVCSLSIK